MFKSNSNFVIHLICFGLTQSQIFSNKKIIKLLVSLIWSPVVPTSGKTSSHTSKRGKSEKQYEVHSIHYPIHEHFESRQTDFRRFNNI